jgi:coenzyme PQQ precursor peptide PqqA
MIATSPEGLSALGLVFRPLVEFRIMWKKPEFTEMRFGFEVTMYIYNR